MKKNNIMYLSIVICLLPIILGIVFYDDLPNQMPIHFTIKDQVDNYANKNIALFAIPIIMAIVQTICLIVNNNRLKEEKEPPILKILKWIIPTLTVLIYLIMLLFSLGVDIWIGKSICLILGILLLIVGNYLPKVSFAVGRHISHPAPKNEAVFKKTNKIMGYIFVGLGIIFLLLIPFV
ncbi:MAG: DUF1648 domain-containing protein [bacterium]|nr:DUF1648 domain-containing protein [bacterium]